MAGELEFKVSQDLIMPIIKEKIKMAIVEAMGGGEALLNNILESYMGLLVDETGAISRYPSDNKHKRIDILIHTLLADAVKEGLKDYLSTRKTSIANAISKYFATAKGSAALANSLQEGIIKGLSNDWRTSIEFKMVEPR